MTRTSPELSFQSLNREAAPPLRLLFTNAEKCTRVPHGPIEFVEQFLIVGGHLALALHSQAERTLYEMSSSGLFAGGRPPSASAVFQLSSRLPLAFKTSGHLHGALLESSR
jgi:hypothetical protein